MSAVFPASSSATSAAGAWRLDCTRSSLQFHVRGPSGPTPVTGVFGHFLQFLSVDVELGNRLLKLHGELPAAGRGIALEVSAGRRAHGRELEIIAETDVDQRQFG